MTQSVHYSVIFFVRKWTPRTCWWIRRVSCSGIRGGWCAVSIWWLVFRTINEAPWISCSEVWWFWSDQCANQWPPVRRKSFRWIKSRGWLFLVLDSSSTIIYIYLAYYFWPNKLITFNRLASWNALPINKIHGLNYRQLIKSLIYYPFGWAISFNLLDSDSIKAILLINFIKMVIYLFYDWSSISELESSADRHLLLSAIPPQSYYCRQRQHRATGWNHISLYCLKRYPLFESGQQKFD